MTWMNKSITDRLLKQIKSTGRFHYLDLKLTKCYGLLITLIHYMDAPSTVINVQGNSIINIVSNFIANLNSRRKM